MTTTLLSELGKRLDWPEEAHVFSPPGAGPAVYSRLAHLKIEKPLARLLGPDHVKVKVGILARDPESNSSDPPVSLICEFNTAITPSQLNTTRKLAWNFCRSPLLITLEPHLTRAWSCYERPDPKTGYFPMAPLVDTGQRDLFGAVSSEDVLHWTCLTSGYFMACNEERFDREQRADVTLLENLRYIRKRLRHRLPEHIAHDLLARIIFIQFLFQRADEAGYTALNPRELQRLHQEGILSERHNDLPSILRHKSDTFALFTWLNERFNGDLFPASYVEEQDYVDGQHDLSLLADFVSGTLAMGTGQHLLWPHYSFDTIPLEFISSIYEEFVTKRPDETSIGEHYTRPFLVDFILDKVLPWSSDKYDVKILDPCCGSGVFLVKAFQRLIQRWRNANPGMEPSAPLLRQLLEKNIFGVDINPEAIRVSSLSLYLAMCDEIDPKYYWTRVHFPPLRGTRLHTGDFFDEDTPEISSKMTRSSERTDKGFDIVVGNAPWGKNSLTQKAKDWCKAHNWAPIGNQSGALFLAKAVTLCKATGEICMIQPAGALLFNVSTSALGFRRKLFSEYKVHEIVNLSDLRFLNIFPEAVGPACVVWLRPVQADEEPIAYWSPKRVQMEDDDQRIVIDDQSLNWVWPEEASVDSEVWASLMWGGRRDLEIVQRIKAIDGRIAYKPKTGFFRGKREKRYPTFLRKRILEDDPAFLSRPMLIDAEAFPRNDDEGFDRARRLPTFELPLAILKATWMTEVQRFKAAVVSSPTEKHLLYSKSYSGFHSTDENALASIVLTYNSALAVYYFFMTSGRLASYRPSLRNKDIKQLPIVRVPGLTRGDMVNLSDSEINTKVFHAYNLSPVEEVLISDFMTFTLPDFKDPANAPGRHPLTTSVKAQEDTLGLYAQWFLKVLAAGFGDERALSATIFISDGTTPLPFCIVGIHLDSLSQNQIRPQPIDRDSWVKNIKELDDDFRKQTGSSLYHRRVARVYVNYRMEGDPGERTVLSVFLVKPNQIRYWTRSAALRDADAVSCDLLSWSETNLSKEEGVVQ